MSNSSKSKRACNLGPVKSIAEDVLLQVFLNYVDAVPKEDDKTMFHTGNYMTKKRGIYDVEVILHLQALITGLVRASPVTRFLSTQLRSVLVELVDQRQKRSICRSKKYPVVLWAKGLAGALGDIIADVRNLSYRTARYETCIKKLTAARKTDLDNFLDSILAESLEGQEGADDTLGLSEVLDVVIPSSRASSSSKAELDGADNLPKKRKLRGHLSTASVDSC